MTAPPARPSAQTRFVLDAMVAGRTEDDGRWEKVFESLERLTDKMKKFENVQDQLMGQAELAAKVTEQVAVERDTLFRKVDETGKVVAQMRLQVMGADLDSSSGPENSWGDSVRREDVRARRRRSQRRVRSDHDRDPSQHGPRQDRRPDTTHGERSINPLPKLNFPKFSGVDPVVWLDKCVDYFTFFKVSDAMWVTAASLHMENNEARWLQVFKLKQRLGNWQQFASAVLAKFGADEYPKALHSLLYLRQMEGVEEYSAAFDQARYSAAVHNKYLDEMFFVTQFIKGLKPEIQSVVQMQLPSSVDRAALLPQLQQDVLEKGKFKAAKSSYGSKQSGGFIKQEAKSVTTGDLSKERQVREYRRVVGLSSRRLNLLLQETCQRRDKFVNIEE
jgi:hypothetical protein